MAIQDDSSVALIPSAYGTSKVYSVIPSNGNGDFTFSRSGNATRVNKGGYIETMGSNVPRLDYPLIDGVVQDCPALLLEPSRTNDTQRSQELDNTYWGKSNGTVTANQTISPDGSQNADRFAENTSTASHLISKSGISIASGVSHTLSVFVKANGRNTFRLFADTGGNSFFAFFNLETKNIGSKQSLTASKIEEYPNDWYRCSISFTSTTTSIYVQFLLSQDNETTSYTGDGSSGMYFWGTQFETGSYPTSYIPTSGSTVTRSADVCNGSGTSAEFNDSEGVLFADVSSVNDGNYKFIGLSDGTATNRLGLFIGNSNNKISVESAGSGTNLGIYDKDIITENSNKIALKYKPNDCSLWVNGFELDVDTSFAAFADGTITKLSFDRGDGANDFYGKTKQLMTFKTALTDSELETLTSWDSFNAMAKGQLYSIE